MAGRGRLLLSDSVAHASLKTAVMHLSCSGFNKGTVPSELLGSAFYSSLSLPFCFFSVLDFILIVGGQNLIRPYHLDTVEVVSPDPLSNEVPNCIKTLGDFPTTIWGAVGTTFGKLKGKWIL